MRRNGASERCRTELRQGVLRNPDSGRGPALGAFAVQREARPGQWQPERRHWRMARRPSFLAAPLRGTSNAGGTMTSVFLAADPGADPVTYPHRELVLSISPGACRRGPLPFPGHAGRKPVLAYTALLAESWELCDAGDVPGPCLGTPARCLPGGAISSLRLPMRQLPVLTVAHGSAAAAAALASLQTILLSTPLFYAGAPGCSPEATAQPFPHPSLLLTAPCSWEQLWELSPLSHPVSA